MARIRSIKPEFPHSETVGSLSRDARLLFVQLWTLVDDEGRARAASRMLASLLYPYDDDAPSLIEGWLEELEKKECIRRYEIEGSSYLDIPNWLKHQKIDKPTKSRLPEFVEASRGLTEPSRTLAPDLGPRILEGIKDHIRAVADATRPNVGKDFEEKFWPIYPKREGANPKAPARKAFFSAVKSGHDPTTIIDGAFRYRDEARRLGQEGTKFVAQAVTWLHQTRWEDYAATAPPTDAPAYLKPPPGAQTIEEIRAQFSSGVTNAAEVGTKIRSDPGVGEEWADRLEKLRLSG